MRSISGQRSAGTPDFLHFATAHGLIPKCFANPD
nr:MAG TPA: hypothetical protein [Caudoviricetes sp.]